jgi:hypothetical protein
MNRMAEKAQRELLFPGAKKNRAERSVSLKHDPIQEFRGSIYQTRLDSAPARVFFPGSAFASCISDCAVDVPGASRAQMERLCRVTELNVPFFGIPKLFMAVVRTAGMSRTPDIRTRAIFEQWACRVYVRYVKGLITERSVTNLFIAGGIIGGVGDGRGKMGFGGFALVPANHKDFLRILKTQGRAAQDKAIAAAEPYDTENTETRDLLEWFKAERVLREKDQDEPLMPLIRASGDGELAEELT